MTDHPAPDPPDAPTTPDEDDLVSSVLDGEASDDDRARVQADPRLRARLAEFTSVHHAVGSVSGSSEEARDAAVAAAVATATEPASGAPSPTLLAARRGRRRRVATIVAVAAVLLVAVPLLAIAFTGRGSEEKFDTTGVALESGNAADSQGDAGAAAPPLSTTVPPQAAAQGLVGPLFVGDLGAINSVDELRFEVSAALADSGALLRQFEATPSSTAPGAGPADQTANRTDAVRCAAAVAAGDPSVGLPVLASTSTWKGLPAFVVVYQSTTDGVTGEPLDPPGQVIVVAGADCAEIERVTS